jgi:hypothetical protein
MNQHLYNGLGAEFLPIFTGFVTKLYWVLGKNIQKSLFSTCYQGVRSEDFSPQILEGLKSSLQTQLLVYFANSF